MTDRIWTAIIILFGVLLLVAMLYGLYLGWVNLPEFLRYALGGVLAAILWGVVKGVMPYGASPARHDIAMEGPADPSAMFEMQRQTEEIHYRLNRGVDELREDFERLHREVYELRHHLGRLEVRADRPEVRARSYETRILLQVVEELSEPPYRVDDATLAQAAALLEAMELIEPSAIEDFFHWSDKARKAVGAGRSDSKLVLSWRSRPFGIALVRGVGKSLLLDKAMIAPESAP